MVGMREAKMEEGSRGMRKSQTVEDEGGKDGETSHGYWKNS